MKKSQMNVRVIILALGVFLCTLLGFFLLLPHISLFENPKSFQEAVRSAGVFGPLLFISLQALQVFFAPIPGQVTGAAAGYLFGVFWGTVYAMIGTTIGFLVIFFLTKKLGRPFVQYVVGEKLMERFDYFAGRHGVFALALVFLLPTFPDDAICFIAGLSKIRLRTLIFVSLTCRLPGTIALSMIGAGFAHANTVLILGVLSVAVAVTIVTYVFRGRLEKIMKKL